MSTSKKVGLALLAAAALILIFMIITFDTVEDTAVEQGGAGFTVVNNMLRTDDYSFSVAAEPEFDGDKTVIAIDISSSPADFELAEISAAINFPDGVAFSLSELGEDSSPIDLPPSALLHSVGASGEGGLSFTADFVGPLPEKSPELELTYGLRGRGLRFMTRMRDIKVKIPLDGIFTQN